MLAEERLAQIEAQDRHSRAQRERILRAFMMIFGIVVAGTVGYLYIGGEHTTLVDAVYMTVISLTTVGYGEIVELNSSPGGRVFTICLLLTGASVFVYFFSTLTAFVVEGNLDRFFFRRRMTRAISQLEQHTIVCGAGATGAYIIDELIQTDRPFVVIDTDQERIAELFSAMDRVFPCIIGDATDDDVLREAGIERATTLAACVEADKDNLLLVVSARLIQPNLRIVARASDGKYIRRLTQSGASSVVTPNRIGGLRMVSELIRPHVVSFLDIMLRDQDRRLRVEEYTMADGDSLAGRPVGELRALRIPDLLVVSVRLANGDWVYNPPDEFILDVGVTVIYIGSPEARRSISGTTAGSSLTSSSSGRAKVLNTSASGPLAPKSAALGDAGGEVDAIAPDEPDTSGPSGHA